MGKNLTKLEKLKLKKKLQRTQIKKSNHATQTISPSSPISTSSNSNESTSASDTPTNSDSCNKNQTLSSLQTGFNNYEMPSNTSEGQPESIAPHVLFVETTNHAIPAIRDTSPTAIVSDDLSDVCEEIAKIKKYLLGMQLKKSKIEKYLSHLQVKKSHLESIIDDEVRCENYVSSNTSPIHSREIITYNKQPIKLTLPPIPFKFPDAL